MEQKTLVDDAVQVMVTEAALAKALNVSPSNVNEWRHGRRPCPDRHVIAMAKIIGRDPRAVAAEVYLARLGKLALISIAGAVATIGTWGTPGPAHAAAGSRDNV
jgi:DNA-binding transcriptional regulator YdaS (Cro superfamily)